MKRGKSKDSLAHSRSSRGGKNNFRLSNRILYTLITLGILSLFAVGVYAYNTGSPTTSGHTWNEIAGIPAGFADGVDNNDNTYYAGGLYGRCFESYSTTYYNAYCLSNWAHEPAYCSTRCQCRSGYERVMTGSTIFDSSARGHGYYWSCRRTDA